jgi:hypothetical protein
MLNQQLLSDDSTPIYTFPKHFLCKIACRENQLNVPPIGDLKSKENTLKAKNAIQEPL